MSFLSKLAVGLTAFIAGLFGHETSTVVLVPDSTASASAEVVVSVAPSPLITATPTRQLVVSPSIIVTPFVLMQSPIPSSEATSPSTISDRIESILTTRYAAVSEWRTQNDFIISEQDEELRLVALKYDALMTRVGTHWWLLPEQREAMMAEKQDIRSRFQVRLDVLGEMPSFNLDDAGLMIDGLEWNIRSSVDGLSGTVWSPDSTTIYPYFCTNPSSCTAYQK